MVYYQKIHYFALQLHVIMNILWHISNVSWNILYAISFKSNIHVFIYVFVLKIFFVLICVIRDKFESECCQVVMFVMSVNKQFYTAEGWREICTLIFPLVQSHTLQLCILNKSWNILSMNNAFGVFSFIYKKKDACFDKNPCPRFILKAAELKLNTARK